MSQDQSESIFSTGARSRAISPKQARHIAPRGKGVFALLASFTFVAVPISLVPAQAARAQSAPSPQSFEIRAQALQTALREFAEVTGLQLVYAPDLVAGLKSPGVSGRMTPASALQALLTNTGIRFRFANESTVTFEKAKRDERVLGPVRVEGAPTETVNGVNGSRDVTATEGTGSFTSGAITIGGKAPTSIKDTPQSVSVLTAQRLEEQNITDFAQAMRQLPGVTPVQGASSLETTFYSRGFPITSIQVDGGAPIATTLANLANPIEFGYFPQIDLAQFDHVEVLRGPAAYFNGYADPSGAVNLVRKKPLDHGQVALEAQAGSWSTYRVMLDATAPLAFDGRLRGRAVASYQDNKQFYDIARDNKTLVYGTLEYDLRPSTVVNAGASYTRQDSVPWYSGQPRFQNGDDLNLPRGVCLCFPWNRWEFDTAEIFASVEQKFGEHWTTKLNFTRSAQESTRKLGYSLGTVNPLTARGPSLAGTFNGYETEQNSLEWTLSGAFDIFGERQRLLVGANRVSSDGAGFTVYNPLISGTSAQPYQPYAGGPSYFAGSPNGPRPPIDIFSFDPGDPRYAEPRAPLPRQYYRSRGQEQAGLYATFDLTALRRWHIGVGIRYSEFEYEVALDNLCTAIPTTGTPGPNSCVGRKIGDPFSPSLISYSGRNFSWPPAISLSYDVTDELTAHAGYTDIYVSQAARMDGDLNAVDPITGSNLEIGLKWASSAGKLNMSIAAYRTEQENFAVRDANRIVRNPDGSIFFDPANNNVFYILDNTGNRIPNGQLDDQRTCCYSTGLDISLVSQGVDFEVGGEVVSGWQIAAAYTWNRNEYQGRDLGLRSFPTEGTVLVSRQPEHLLKLWTSYDFGKPGGNGWLSRLSLSGGVHWRSEAFQAGTACTAFGVPDALGVSPCLASAPYSYTQDAYAVWSARVDYNLSNVWSVALNADNIFDERYYQTMGASDGGNWYGAPRSFMLTMRGRF